MLMVRCPYASHGGTSRSGAWKRKDTKSVQAYTAPKKNGTSIISIMKMVNPKIYDDKGKLDGRRTNRKIYG